MISQPIEDEVRYPENSTCHFRGSYRDPEFRLLYPSSRTYCHKSEVPFHVAPKHQQNYCLSKEHCHCPLFTEMLSEPPDEAIYRASKKAVRKKLFKKLFSWGS